MLCFKIFLFSDYFNFSRFFLELSLVFLKVAIKLLSEMSTEACSALWKEARVMQNYHHENVVKFYGIVNDCRVSHDLV